MDQMNPAGPVVPPSAYPSYPAVNPIAGPAKVFGIIFAVLAVLNAIGAVSLMVLSRTPLQPNLPPTDSVPFNISHLFIAIAALVLAMAILYAATAFGLLARKSWGRTLLMVTSILSLISIPVGTILGAFGLYFFMRHGAKEDYERLVLQG